LKPRVSHHARDTPAGFDRRLKGGMKAEEFEEEAESQIPRFIILCPSMGVSKSNPSNLPLSQAEGIVSFKSAQKDFEGTHLVLAVVKIRIQYFINKVKVIFILAL
jgi:hypothetical protein